MAVSTAEKNEKEVKQALESAVTDDDNKPMEVMLPDENEGTPQEPEAPPQPPDKKETDLDKVERNVAPKKRYEGNVARLREERRNLSETAQRLFTENQALEQKLGQLSRAGMANYERGLVAEQRLAEIMLERAITAGEVTEQAKAQAEISRVAAELNDVKAWKSANPETKDAPKAPQQPRQTQDPYSALPRAARDWISENPWFDMQSEEYDEDMHNFAVSAAALIENRLKRQGKADQINTASYFEELGKEIAREFHGEDEVAEDNPPPPKSIVAPVTRTGAPASGPSPNKGNRAVQLTAEEVGFIRKNLAAGSIKYPADHPDPAKRGRVKTLEDAAMDYARRKSSSSR